MYFPKTGKTFTTSQGIINHIKHNYNNSEEAYIDVHKITNIKFCHYCNNKSKFITFFKGYHKTCFSDICLKKAQIDTNKEISNNKSKNLIKDPFYIQHIKDNINFYINAQTPFYDNYLQKVITDTRLYFNKSDIVDLKICKIFNIEYEYNYFYHNDKPLMKHISISKKTANIHKSGITCDELLYILENKSNIDILAELYKSNIKIKSILKFICDATVYKKVTYKPQKSTALLDTIFIKDGVEHIVNKEFNSKTADVTYLYSDQEINTIFGINRSSICLCCKTKYNMVAIKYSIKNKTLSYVDKKLSATSCGNSDCYLYVRHNHPELYKCSDEKKKKHSATMKEKIKNNEFTPVNNRTRAKYIVDSILFKSSWEVILYLYAHYNGIKIIYENIIIQYNDNNNYYVDFNDPVNKILYEVKPNKYFSDKKILDKAQAAFKYATDHNMKYMMISEYWFYTTLYKDIEFLQYLESVHIEGNRDTVLKTAKKFITYYM